MFFANQRGNVIAYVVIALTTVAALAVGALYMTSASSLGEIGANNLNRAYFLAMAGKDYALINNLANTGGRNFTLASGDKFQLAISGNNITSTGVVNEGTPFEARRTISITKTGFASRPDISFTKDIYAFGPVQTQAGFITTDASAAKVSMGQVGGNNFGAVYYGGNVAQGNCQNGQCFFGSGFRAFFVLQFAPGSSGEGFTFAVFNGDPYTNDIYSVGGGYTWGELLGYAGDSRIGQDDKKGFLDGNTRTSNKCPTFLGCQGGRGIQPPKWAIEFDTLSESKFGIQCDKGKFNDGNEGDGPTNHVAYLFWGKNDKGSYCGSTAGANTFDDIRHGAGDKDDPQNARSESDPAGMDATSYLNGSIYGWPATWLLVNSPTNIYALRVEVTRSTLPDLVTGTYTVKTWIKQCPADDLTCPAYADGSDYANTKIAYTADAAALNRTFTLSPTFHQKFSTFYFGWTSFNPGPKTSSISIYRFAMFFLK